MKVYVVRHGDKAEGDHFNEYLKHQDEPLSESGEAKAKMLCTYFKDISITQIYTSEYLRTKQTAKYVAELKRITPIEDRRLNEIDNGVIEFLSDEEIKKRFPKFWTDFFSYSKDVRFPDGETGEEVKTRQKELFDNILKYGQDVLLFSHEGYMRLLACHILGIPVYKRNQFKFDFCGIMELYYDVENKLWKIVRLNQIVENSSTPLM